MEITQHYVFQGDRGKLEEVGHTVNVFNRSYLGRTFSCRRKEGVLLGPNNFLKGGGCQKEGTFR